MTTTSPVPEPNRATEIARLELARLTPAEPLDAVFRRACERSAAALDVERVGVWLFIDDRTALRCANLFERSKGEHSAGAILRVADFPTYFSSIAIRKAVPAEVAGTEPWTAELAAQYLRPLGIGSMLDAGIFVDGQLVGVVCHEHVGPPRGWTTEESDFAGSVADLLALRVQSAEVRELRAAFQTHEDRAAALDKAAALEQLAAGVAHDLRNLLAIFHGYGELLAGRPDLPDDARDQARDVVLAAEQGLELATGLMAFARPEGASPVVLDLGAVATGLLPVLRSAVGSGTHVEVDAAPDLGHVFVGQGPFTRLLMNLVLNGSEAMPRGGTVQVRLAPVQLDGDPGYLGRFVLLEVADTGPGIPADVQRRMFEPYFTTKSKGTGLGLAVVRQVADRAGAVVRVDSGPGRGTTFRVYFPRVGAGGGPG